MLWPKKIAGGYMKHKITTEDFDKLSDDFKKEYEKKGDAYELKIDGLEIEDTSALKNTLTKVREDLKTAEKTLKGYKDIDPVKYKDLITEQEVKTKELRDKELEIARKNKDIETLEKRFKDDHQKALDEITTKHQLEVADLSKKVTDTETNMSKTVSGLTKALEKEMIEKKSQAALAKFNGDVFILEPHVKTNLRLVKENDEYVTRVVDPKGSEKEPYRKNDKGEYLTEEDFVAEMKQSERFINNFSDEKLPGGSGYHKSSNNSGNNQTEVSGVNRIKKGLEAAKNK